MIALVASVLVGVLIGAWLRGRAPVQDMVNTEDLYHQGWSDAVQIGFESGFTTARVDKSLEIKRGEDGIILIGYWRNNRYSNSRYFDALGFLAEDGSVRPLQKDFEEEGTG